MNKDSSAYVLDVLVEDVIAREHEYEVHDQVHEQQETLKARRNGGAEDGLLAMLAKRRR
jgi:hypothetical protein